MSTTKSVVTPAVYLFLFQNDHLLLLKRKNTGFEDGNYSLVAGHLEEFETFREAMVREAYEEARIKLYMDKLNVVHIMHRKQPDQMRIDVFLTSLDWQGDPYNNEPDKCSELKWFLVDDLPDNIIPFVRAAIEHIRNHTYYSEYGW